MADNVQSSNYTFGQAKETVQLGCTVSLLYALLYQVMQASCRLHYLLNQRKTNINYRVKYLNLRHYKNKYTIPTLFIIIFDPAAVTTAVCFFTYIK